MCKNFLSVGGLSDWEEATSSLFVVVFSVVSVSIASREKLSSSGLFSSPFIVSGNNK